MARSLDPTDSPGRIGYVLKKYPRLSETFILQEILGVEGSGAEVEIISLKLPDEGRFHGDLSRVRARTRYIPPFKSPSVLETYRTIAELGEDGPARLRRAFEFLDLVPAERRSSMLYQALHVARFVRERGIEHLHAHFMTVAARTSYLAHILTDVPFSVTAHAKDIYRNGVDREIFRRVAGAAAALVTVCDANKDYIEKELLAGSPCNLRRIYNGLPETPRASGPREKDLILGVGRLVEKKGFHILLEALRVLADQGIPFRCRILGDGDQREALEVRRSALRLEDQVEFAGPQPREAVLAEMGRARVLAAPCVTGTDGNRDALPTVLIEGLALGLPAVTTPVAGIPEIITHEEDGLIVEEGNISALAQALRRMLQDDELHSRLSARGPSKVTERFDQRRTLPELLRIFQAGARREALPIS